MVVLSSDSEYVDLVVEGDDLAGAELAGSTFVRCVFKNVSLAGGDLTACRFDRCEFTTTDLSNVDATDAEVTRSRIVDSKLLGAAFAGGSLHLVQVSDTHAPMLSCFKATIRKTTFSRCDLTDSDWREGQITESALVACDLSGAQFTQASTRAVDIRGSVLSGSLSITQARGFVVGREQLLALTAGLLQQVGARIDDDPLPELADLPGGRDVQPARPVEPGVGLRGIQAARARLARS